MEKQNKNKILQAVTEENKKCGQRVPHWHAKWRVEGGGRLRGSGLRASRGPEHGTGGRAAPAGIVTVLEAPQIMVWQGVKVRKKQDAFF